MSELSDYRRIVESNLIKTYERKLAACHAEIADLRRQLALHKERLPSRDHERARAVRNEDAVRVHLREETEPRPYESIPPLADWP